MESDKKSSDELNSQKPGEKKEQTDKTTAKSRYQKPALRKYGQIDHVAAYGVE